MRSIGIRAVAFSVLSLVLFRIHPSAKPAPIPFQGRICAPYVACWTNLSVNSLANSTGNKFYTLAFMISNGSANSAPYWDGKTPMSDNKYVTDIASLRAQGGDVIVSFGGQGGKEMALVHSQAGTLQAAYQQAISKYNLKWIDFDIEGSTIFDTAANTRRNQAIRNLQAANPGLFVAYTVPSTSPDSGVTQSTLRLLENAKKHGVEVGLVNIMAMNYGPSYCGDMAQHAINVAGHTRDQLKSIGMQALVGITPLVGENMFPCENFTVANTRTVLNYATANGYVGFLSFWVMDADVNYANVNIFKAFNGSVATALRPPGNPNQVNGPELRPGIFHSGARSWNPAGKRIP